MRKFIFCFAASSLLVSCSSSNESIDDMNKLVPAIIKISSDQEDLTRGYLGFPNESSITTVPVNFEKGDAVYVIDGPEHTFTIDNDGSSTTMHGSWLEDMNIPCYAMYGSTQTNGLIDFSMTVPNYPIDEDGKIIDDGNGNTRDNIDLTMHFDLPYNTQHTRHLTRNNQTGSDLGVSCDEDALLAFAYPVFKGIEMKFIPVVSFLYFTSASPRCKIVSDQEIAGDFNVKYKGPIATNISGYATAQQLWRANKLFYYASKDYIICEGEKLNESDALYKYVVAIKPSETYNAKTGINILVGNGNGNGFEDGSGFKNLVDVELAPNVVYYLGNVDPVSNGGQSAPARGVEPTTLPFGR